MKIFKLIAIILLLLYFLTLAAQAVPETPLWFVDTLMHEAGHWIYAIFGEFIGILGGSFNQILVPVIFFVYFLIRRDLYASAIILFWVGENFLSVAAYAHDAILMQLPLLGDASTHDWHWLLTNAGLLNHTYLIAGAIKVIGIVCIIAAGIGGIYAAFIPPADPLTEL